MTTKHKEHLKRKSGSIIASWSTPISARLICPMHNLSGVKSTFQKKKLKIVSPTSWRQLLRWQERHIVMVPFISFQKTITWLEMTSWYLVMCGTNGNERRNAFTVAHAINSLILPEMMDIS